MLKIKFNARELESSLKKYSKQMGKDAETLIQDYAVAGAKQLAMRTEPFGLSGKAKKIGELSISKDVSQAYASNARTYNEIKKISSRKASAYAAAISANDQAAADKIVRSLPNFQGSESSDSGSHLESLRNHKGRVSSPSISNLTNEGEVSAIRAKKLHNMGMAKAGWVQCSQAIQGKARFPAWLRKSASLGTAKIMKRGWNTIVSLYNKVKYTTNVLPLQKLNAALKATEQGQIRRINLLIGNSAKNF